MEQKRELVPVQLFHYDQSNLTDGYHMDLKTLLQSKLHNNDPKMLQSIRVPQARVQYVQIICTDLYSI